jgi:hypothetical protein
MTSPVAPGQSERSLVNWTALIYALHAFSLLTGIIGTATVIGAFLTGWPSIIAVILNYVKRSDARGTWLESHFRWQIRTSFTRDARPARPRHPGSHPLRRRLSWPARRETGGVSARAPVDHVDPHRAHLARVYACEELAGRHGVFPALKERLRRWGSGHHRRDLRTRAGHRALTQTDLGTAPSTRERDSTEDQ